MRCFVIQPFEERFTKRFYDIFKPAIEECNLEAYRLDCDPSVDLPIQAIEEGIRDSSICLADITLDNPNVWYELGYAFALNRPTVMVCSDERIGRYPFDIQHRTVSQYKVQSKQDFIALHEAIVRRLKGVLLKTAALEAVSSNERMTPIEGLTQPELAVIASATGSVTLPMDATPLYSLKGDMERAGFAGFAFTLGVKRLIEKAFAKVIEGESYNGDTFQALALTDKAWQWIESNEDKFLLQRRPNLASNSDDIPF
ncbi:MAG TPA: hypothetical protein VNQ90_14480 [Chthoniobacteraceae bacterium]|nr:hypothetical protein [Chthoniobacteraceae bacterium]